MNLRPNLIVLCMLIALGIGLYQLRHQLPVPVPDTLWPRDDIATVRARQTPKLNATLATSQSQVGAPVYLRVFKEEAELELWIARDAGEYTLFKTYPICSYSGALGPKLREGDRQAPEGFYTVGKAALNPNSSYHLSFNLGFPNAYDRAQGRTGSFLMVHGDCVSIGCYAMTDPAIEEIYVLVEAALKGGQSNVPVHAFPFRPTPARLAQVDGHKWADFWHMLAPAYTTFEATRQPPRISVSQGRYEVAAR